MCFKWFRFCRVNEALLRPPRRPRPAGQPLRGLRGHQHQQLQQLPLHHRRRQLQISGVEPGVHTSAGLGRTGQSLKLCDLFSNIIHFTGWNGGFGESQRPQLGRGGPGGEMLRRGSGDGQADLGDRTADDQGAAGDQPVEPGGSSWRHNSNDRRSYDVNSCNNSRVGQQQQLASSWQQHLSLFFV